MQSEKKVKMKITELTSRASKSNFKNTLSIRIACSTIHTRTYSTIVAIKIFNFLRFKIDDKDEERQKKLLDSSSRNWSIFEKDEILTPQIEGF